MLLSMFPEFPKVIHCKGSCVICYKKCVSNLLCLMNQLVVLCSNSSSPIPQDHIPFGVVGSKEEIIAGGKRIRARQYPWGLVEGQFYIT